MTGRRVAAVAVVVFLRWLAAARVPVTVSGVTFAVPALAFAALTVTAVSAAVVALVMYRLRADRAAAAAWRAGKAGAR